MFFHLLKSDHAHTGLDGLGRQVFQPALRWDAQQDLGSVFQQADRFPCASRMPAFAASGRAISAICARLSRGRASGTCRMIWYKPPADRTVHHRAHRCDMAADPRGAGTFKPTPARLAGHGPWRRARLRSPRARGPRIEPLRAPRP